MIEFGKWVADSVLRRVLVYVGCMITILSLAYSTFTQQLVNLVLLPVSGENASLGNLPRCESWEAYDGTSSFNDPNGSKYSLFGSRGQD